MRGDLLIAALEVIGTVAITTVEFLDVLTSDYATLRRAVYGRNVTSSRMREALRVLVEEMREDARSREQAKDLLYRLKRDGLIARKISGDGTERFVLTDRGRVKRATLAKQLCGAPRYSPERSNDIIIVAFDIPEKERSKRVWLRAALKNLGLRSLQKSLWVGRVRIPETFIADLEEKRIIPYTEIFSVTKSGTIQKLA